MSSRRGLQHVIYQGLVIVSLDDYSTDDCSPSKAVSISLAKSISRQLNQQWCGYPLTLSSCTKMKSHRFGGLVTWKWWDTLYLVSGSGSSCSSSEYPQNVGLASYIGENLILGIRPYYLGRSSGLIIMTGKLFPQAELDCSFVRSYVQRALDLDDKKSARPLEVPTKDADTADQTFDALKWTKSGAVIRMLVNYTGEDMFIRGVSVFLKRHTFGNASSQDFWKNLSQETGYDIDSMMSTWVTKVIVWSLSSPALSYTSIVGRIPIHHRVRKPPGCQSTAEMLPWDRHSLVFKLVLHKRDGIMTDCRHIPLQIRTMDGHNMPVTLTNTVLATRETQLNITKPYKFNAGIRSLGKPPFGRHF
jgi:hypothetical protein